LQVGVSHLLAVAQRLDDVEILLHGLEPVRESMAQSYGVKAAPGRARAYTQAETTARQRLQCQTALRQLNRVAQRQLKDRRTHLDVFRRCRRQEKPHQWVGP
jgi:hypothetical protein